MDNTIVVYSSSALKEHSSSLMKYVHLGGKNTSLCIILEDVTALTMLAIIASLRSAIFLLSFQPIGRLSQNQVAIGLWQLQ